MPIVADQQDEEQEGGMTVSQPQTQIRQPADIDVSGGQSTSIGGAQGQQAQTGATTPKKGVGSGLVTDTKKYIQANMPAAKQLAGAVGQKFQKEAASITKGAMEKKADLQRQLQTSKARMDAAKQFGQQQIQQAGQQELDQKNIQRFRDIVTGKERFDTAQYNALEEQRKAEALKQKARRAERGDVRAQLLRETFGGTGGNQYTRGQGTLDQLLLAGSAEGRRAMIEQARGAASQAQTGIREARKQALVEMSKQQRENEQLRQQLSEGVTGAESEITSTVEQKIADELAARQAKIGALQEKLRGYDPRFVSSATGGDSADLELTREEARMLGVSEGQELYDIDLAKTLRAGRSMTREEAATQEDLTRMQALAKLKGGTQEFFDPNREFARQMSEREMYEGASDIQKSIKQKAQEYRDAVIARQRRAAALSEYIGRTGGDAGLREALRNLQRVDVLSKRYRAGKKVRIKD